MAGQNNYPMNIPWSDVCHLVWDFTFPDTLAPSHLHLTGKEAGTSATDGEEREVAKYQTVAIYYKFVPIAIETLGSMGQEAKAFLLELGRRLRQQMGEPRSTSFLLQWISIAIQKGNVVAMMGSIPRRANCVLFFSCLLHFGSFGACIMLPIGLVARSSSIAYFWCCTTVLPFWIVKKLYSVCILF